MSTFRRDCKRRATTPANNSIAKPQTILTFPLLLASSQYTPPQLLQLCHNTPSLKLAGIASPAA
jgi:hypothetical protein